MNEWMKNKRRMKKQFNCHTSENLHWFLMSFHFFFSHSHSFSTHIYTTYFKADFDLVFHVFDLIWVVIVMLPIVPSISWPQLWVHNFFEEKKNARLVWQFQILKLSFKWHANVLDIRHNLYAQIKLIWFGTSF